MKIILLCVLLLAGITPQPLLADDFYKGKTVRVIVGGTAGGGFDVYTRAMTRHMGKHIPGHPIFIVENMTGAATRIAAKYLHSAAKPDGLTFGIFNGYLILSQVLDPKGFDFNVRQFEWLGVPIQDNVACVLRKETGITNVEQWMAAKTPVKMGGLGPGNSTSDAVRIVKATLNLPIQLVEGYKGTADLRSGCRQWRAGRCLLGLGIYPRDVDQSTAIGRGNSNPAGDAEKTARPTACPACPRFGENRRRQADHPCRRHRPERDHPRLRDHAEDAERSNRHLAQSLRQHAERSRVSPRSKKRRARSQSVGRRRSQKSRRQPLRSQSADCRQTIEHSDGQAVTNLVNSKE